MIEFDFIANPKVSPTQKFGKVILENQGIQYEAPPRLTTPQKVKKLIKVSELIKARKSQ